MRKASLHYAPGSDEEAVICARALTRRIPREEIAEAAATVANARSDLLQLILRCSPLAPLIATWPESSPFEVRAWRTLASLSDRSTAVAG